MMVGYVYNGYFLEVLKFFNGIIDMDYLLFDKIILLIVFFVIVNLGYLDEGIIIYFYI